MQLTVREVSHLLKIPEAAVYRWIQRGTLPAYRVQDQYCFNRAELLEWATLHKVEVSPELFQQTEDRTGALPALTDALEQGGVHRGLEAAGRAAALRAVSQVVPLPTNIDREAFFQVLLAREKLGSTAVGEGIAIPHVRHPAVLAVPGSVISLCFLERPVGFGALDGQPVHTLFALVSPRVRAHLHLLSRLVFALLDPRFKSAVLNCADTWEILDAARCAEARLAPVPLAAEGDR
ncbi:MAG: PTS sugar transporter subunit IIA [Candidatus Latescibacteria bacterium]|nr:PTS sugar transporter subunit IIA [Candidatus Latescibacterota bacterium]